MRYRKPGCTNVHISELCLGVMTFGSDPGEPTARAITDVALDRGSNFLERADIPDPRQTNGGLS